MKNIFWIIFGNFFFAGCLVYAQTSTSTQGILNPDSQNFRSLRPPRQKRVFITKRDKQSISVDNQDKSKYTAFRKDSNSGILRLHDAEKCGEDGKVIRADEPCPWNIIGKATFYSFRTEDYSNKIFSDLQFEDKTFKIVGLNSLGFLSDLGDISIENLNLQSKGIKELAEFQPSTNLEEIEKHFNLARSGFQIGDQIYKTEFKMDSNKTYVLRSIAYESKVFWKIGKRKINILAEDKRKDIIVIFRVVRENDDGSVNILWRKLQSKDAPKIETKD